MPSIKRKVFGFIRQFSSATGTSGSVLEEAEEADQQQLATEDEEPQQQSFIHMFLNGQLRKRKQPEVYNAKTGVDLPLLLLDPLNSSLYAAYTGPEGGLTQVPPVRQKPVTNIATLDDELNLSFDTESFTEELDTNGRVSPNNNYLHRTDSVSSGLEMFQPPAVAETDSDGFQTFFNWTQPHERAFGLSTSLYECHPFTKVHAGEPIADVFGVCARENNCVLVLGDGVNWGEKSRLAARCGVRGVMDYLSDHLYNTEKPIRTTLEIFHHLLQSFHTGHQLILQEGGTLTTLCAVVVSQLRDREEFVACAANVGDSLAFVHSQRHGVREITLASHDISQMRDMRDAGGALGPVDGVNPELHNFTCAMTVVEPGDIVFITSDGISDNFDPVVGKFCVTKAVDKENIIKFNGDSNGILQSPQLSGRRADVKPLQNCQVEAVAKELEDIMSYQLPSVEAHQRHELMLLRMEDLLQNGVTIGDPASQTAQDLCHNLVNFASQLTMAKRRILEDPDLYPAGSKHKREDQKLRRRLVRAKIAEMPGKLDHASVVAYTVGVHEASRNSTPNVDVMVDSHPLTFSSQGEIPAGPISYDRSDTVPFGHADPDSDPTHSASEFPSVSVVDHPVIDPPSFMNELNVDVERTPRPVRRFNETISTSPVVEVYSNGAYCETLVAALDSNLWRDSAHNLCELTLPIRTCELRTSGSVGGLSSSSAQLSPDDLERLDSGLISISPGEFLSDREEPPTPTDGILNGFSPVSDAETTVSLRPLPAVFDSKRNSRKLEETDTESVKMIDDISSASSMAGSLAAVDSQSELDLSGIRFDADDNDNLDEDVANDGVDESLTERAEESRSVEELKEFSGKDFISGPSPLLLSVPGATRCLDRTALETESFDLSTIMEMSTSAEDVTMPSISAVTKSFEPSEDISPAVIPLDTHELCDRRTISGSVAALVEDILGRCEGIVAVVTVEPRRLAYRDSFKHSSLVELEELRPVNRSESQVLLPASTCEPPGDLAVVTLRTKPMFPCDSLVDLKTKSNSYYGATVDNPICTPESETATSKTQSLRTAAVRTDDDKRSSARPFNRLEKLVHKTDKSQVTKIKTAGPREPSKDRKKHGRHSPQRHTVAVEMGFMQKIRNGTGFMTSLKHPRTSVSSDASSSGDSEKAGKSLTTSPLKSPRSGSGFGWSPTKSIQRTWKALSARETMPEAEGKTPAQRSASTSARPEPTGLKNCAKLPPVSPRYSGSRTPQKESVSTRISSAFGRTNKYNVAAAEGGGSGAAPIPQIPFHRQKSFDFSLLLKRKSGGKAQPAAVESSPDTEKETSRNLLVRQKTDMGNYSCYKLAAEDTGTGEDLESKTGSASATTSSKPRLESTV